MELRARLVVVWLRPDAPCQLMWDRHLFPYPLPNFHPLRADGYLASRIQSHYCNMVGTVPPWAHEDTVSWAVGAWVRHYMLTQPVPVGIAERALGDILVTEPCAYLVERCSPSDAVNGKPRVGSVDFSLSHACGVVVGAVGGSPSEVVGVDVSLIGSPSRVVDLRKPLQTALVDQPLETSAFTPRERKWVGASSMRFHVMWSLNEAFLKCIGMGWAGKLGSACNGLHPSIVGFEVVPAKEPPIGSWVALDVCVYVAWSEREEVVWKRLEGWHFEMAVLQQGGHQWVIAHCSAQRTTLDGLSAPRSYVNIPPA
jgi:hypothetical protein